MNLKKLTFNQLLMIGGGFFVAVMVIAAIVIQSSSKPAPRVATKKPVTFEAPTNNIELEQIRQELDVLKKLIASNAETSKSAFSQTAAAIDRQSQNIETLEQGVTLTASRVQNLERARIGAQVQIIKPESQSRPTRSERLEKERKASVTASGTQRLSTEGDYKVLAAVGDRAWISNGNEEYSLRVGESIPISGQLVVQEIRPDGQISVNVEARK